ncbi:MAG: S-layer homology domain-containing protein [Eubacteriales bacterium]|nr:S-layer homology domain-containing protein [Eubacteriales bacterium]
MNKTAPIGASCTIEDILEGAFDVKDKKLLTAALLLMVTIVFVWTALCAGLPSAQAAGNAPVAQPVEAETCIEVAIELALAAADPDRDVVLYQLTERPRLGTATIEGSTLTYTPGAKSGRDRFAYTAVDAEGNTGRPATIVVQVRKNRAGLVYADMAGDPAHYGALYLAERQVMTGERIGGCAFFRPEQPVTRSEFIAMATAAAGLPVEPTGQTDFADDEGLSPWAKPFISTAAANGLVSGYRMASGLSEIRGHRPITLAEASTVVDNLLDGSLDGTQYVLAGEHDTALDWAQHAVSTLTRLEVLSPQTAQQGTGAQLTRRTACELLYRAMRLLDR